MSVINYKNYPECMVAAYLPSNEGNDLRRVDGGVVFKSQDMFGSTYKNGLLHSFDDQPAISLDNGTNKFWYRNGYRHRDGDKPAVVKGEKYMEWWVHGRLHRYDYKPSIVIGEVDPSMVPEWATP